MYFPALFLIPILFPTFSLEKKQVKESGKKTFICINSPDILQNYFKNGHPWHLTGVPVNIDAAQVSYTA